jgi:hypothetical protein
MTTRFGGLHNVGLVPALADELAEGARLLGLPE